MDPERVNGLNLYAYCNNNPVMYIDPDGTEVVILSIFALLALLVSAVAVLAILDFEYRTHTIRDLFVSVGDVFGNIFNGISGFFTSFVNAKNVSLPGLDYGGYVQWIFSKWKPGTWPGDDPTVSPGDGFEWKGKAGAPVGSPYGYWENKETGDRLHPDFQHKPPKGPHWGWYRLKKFIMDLFRPGGWPPNGPPVIG